jgi:pimeloyl-ACP methyl ester carboxylesterase
LLAATGIQATHRSGQTFLTWNEDVSVSGEQYHIYRSTSPITTANIGQTELLTSRWGALDDNTSVHELTGAGAPATFVIQDLGQPLSVDDGLFVFTTPVAQNGNAWYAVTQVTNGVEDRSLTAGQNTLTTTVVETAAAPEPVLVSSVNGGKGRVYTQFMDYASWNPTFQGYAYNYSVALPFNYSADTAWPLKVVPHAYGERYRFEPQAEYEWPVIQVFVDDPGSDAGTTSTWWYGFAADHNYQTDGPIPTSGQIENFTEQRVLQAVDEVMASFNVDATRVHVEGNSMGASGALSLGIRYGNIFAGIYASQPMTNYATSPLFQDDFQKLWGTQAAALPVVNSGPHATQLTPWNGTAVYDWMNHQVQIVNRRSEDMAFLMFGHGKDDNTIDWQTQGRPFIPAVNSANVAYVAEQRDDWEHNFMGFDFLNRDMLSGNNTDLGDFILPINASVPAIANATASGPNVPGPFGNDLYNSAIDWSVPWNPFHLDPVDTPSRYEISLRSRDGVQTATIAPRRLTAFTVTPGNTYSWRNIDNSTSATVQNGTMTADTDGQLVIPDFQIGMGEGNRLVIVPDDSTPKLVAPGPTTTNQRPEFQWTSIPGASQYELWVKNLSTGQNPALRIFTTATDHSPLQDLGIGRYRVWVRSRDIMRDLSDWSAAHDVHINTRPVLTNLPETVKTATPAFSWTAVPGATRYDLWLDNTTTSQSQVIRQSNLTSTDYTVPDALPIGNYTLWVRAMDASGAGAAWSAGEAFTVAPPAILTAPVNPTFDDTPTFEWVQQAGAETYELFIRNRVTQAIETDVTGLSATQWTPTSTMAGGDYRWWVRATGPGGFASSWSESADFSIGGMPTVLAPGGTTADRTPSITWTAVDGAVRYELWVSRLDGGGRVIHETSLTPTSFSPSVDMERLTYRIWVRAVSVTGVFSDWSRPLDFTITA